VAELPTRPTPVVGAVGLVGIDDLLDQLERTTQLSRSAVGRVVADIVEYFGESVEPFVRRRHRELQQDGNRNDQIWDQLGQELRSRPFAAPELSPRQLRRIVYG
jgi:hypothetical protein